MLGWRYGVCFAFAQLVDITRKKKTDKKKVAGLLRLSYFIFFGATFCILE
jgi:hypothetical protein